MLEEAAGAVTESAAEAALQKCSEIVEYLAVVPDFTGNDAVVFEAGGTGFTDFGVVAFSESS